MSVQNELFGVQLDRLSTSSVDTRLGLRITDGEQELADAARQKTITALANLRFANVEGNTQPNRTLFISYIQNTIDKYNEEFSFTQRCWHVVKGVFGFGNEWSTIKTLQKEQIRLQAEDIILRLKGKQITSKDELLNILPKVSKPEVVGVQPNYKPAFRQEVLDQTLFLLVADTDKIDNCDTMIEALIQGGANPNRFYPLDEETQKRIMEKNPGKAFAYKNCLAATAFGMYMLSVNVSSGGVASFGTRADQNKGYLCEPRTGTAGPAFLGRLFSVLPFSISETVPLPGRWVPTVRAPVTEFLPEDRRGWINQQ